MHWEKYGLIWAPRGEVPWAQSHASLPVVHALGPERWWTYVGCRDAAGKTRIARLDVDPSALPHGLPTVRGVAPSPVLSLGEPGTFDDSGVMPSWLVDDGDRLRLYYIGWNVSGTVPYRLSIGLAVSEDGGASFRRHAIGPIIDRCRTEPYFVTAPCVLHEGSQWRMWYVSCTGWTQICGRWEPRYHVKYAESTDGINWQLTSISCVEAGENEAIARPCVIPTQYGYAMLFSSRSVTGYRTDRLQSYRLGYAASRDGIHWQRRDDQAGIERSTDGWDSQMIEYCWQQRHAAETYLLYNGNDFGRTGFGLARLTAT